MKKVTNFIIVIFVFLLNFVTVNARENPHKPDLDLNNYVLASQNIVEIGNVEFIEEIYYEDKPRLLMDAPIVYDEISYMYTLRSYVVDTFGSLSETTFCAFLTLFLKIYFTFRQPPINSF